MLEGFQVVDRDFRYLHVNEAAARHGRATKSALLGRTMMECYPGIEQTEVFAHIRRCLEQRTSHEMENAFTFPDGSTGYFELRIEPVPPGVSVLSIDVTQRREAEAALARAETRLRHAQRMEAIGRLAAGIAHDFNNLLTVMLAEGERALARPEGQGHTEVETMVSAARMSADLTRQLLAYSRHSVLDRKVVEPTEILRNLEGILRRALGTLIDLRIEVGREVGRVEADRSQLEQIVLNLVLNARDAIEGAGTITVSLSSVELDADHVRAHPGAEVGPHVLLTVSDDGRGMDEATRERIFEPYFTTKERDLGTGLGLATVYGIVKQHGGNIWVYSEPGKGSTFKIYLPSTDRPLTTVKPVPVAAPVRPRPGDRATVLVAEDAKPLRQLLEDSLTAAGYRALVAGSGEEALSIWEREGGAISLLITDATMPGISGIELIEQLRSRRKDLPVICTSGYATAQLRNLSMIAPDVNFVEKPFSPRVLIDRVRALLDGA